MKYPMCVCVYCTVLYFSPRPQTLLLMQSVLGLILNVNVETLRKACRSWIMIHSPLK